MPYDWFLAFIGGIILNGMPCVLPVLAFKTAHILETCKDDAKTAQNHGLAYSAGTICFFLGFALFAVILRASGKSMGWGTQFQNPAFTAGLIIAIFIFALNALGIFELTFSFRTSAESKNTLSSSFANGVFAAVMSTPCTAPFLGTAVVIALGQETSYLHTFIIFFWIGLGLAFPYLLISFVPTLRDMLPKPGPWMELFKKLTGFTLIGAAIWLFGVLQQQVSPEGTNKFLFLLLLITVSLWLMQRWSDLGQSARKRWTVRAAAAVVMTAGLVLLSDFPPPNISPNKHNSIISWVAFCPQQVESILKAGKPVLMDYTADWCINCKVLEAASIEVQSVKQTLDKTGIVAVKADWTLPNDTIEQWLNKIGRKEIPAVAIYLPDGTHRLMPITFTAQDLVKALEEASTKSVAKAM